MVYASDFYTTRRPYSSRPYVSSYNITVRSIPHMPYIAHKRIVKIIHSPIRIYHSGTYLPLRYHTRVRPSVLAAELNRIRYLTRPSSISYVEKYLNSKDYIDFDDETRDIRAKTDSLLRRIHVYVPRPSPRDYQEEINIERLRSDDYVRRILNAKNTRKEFEDLPWYTTPECRHIGDGNLACVKYVGGRPHSRRRPYYTVNDLKCGDVQTDVNFLSFYSKNRRAADDASPILVTDNVTRKEVRYAPLPSEITHENESNEEETAVEIEEKIEVSPRREEELEPEIRVSKKKKDKKAKDKDNEKKEDIVDDNMYLEGEDIKKVPDDETIKRVEEYLKKKAEEARIEEEQRAAEAEKKRKAEEEKQIAFLAKLKLEEDKYRAEVQEQERKEYERRMIEKKAEEAKREAERLIEDEKLFKEAVDQAIADEEERATKEKAEEERKKLVEDEEKAGPVVSDYVSESFADEHIEHSDHANLSDQEKESLPYKPDDDEHTEVEEEAIPDLDEIENPFLDDGGENSTDKLCEPVAETIEVTECGGEQAIEKSDAESQPDIDIAESNFEATQENVETNFEENKNQYNSNEDFEAESAGDADEAIADEVHVDETHSQETSLHEATDDEKEEEHENLNEHRDEEEEEDEEEDEEEEE